MKRLMVTMIRSNIDNLPAPAIPGDGFRIRSFGGGDEDTWARIECLAGEFESEIAAKERFSRDFPDRAVLRDHCLFVEDHTGETVGTATVMSGRLDGRAMGRLGWVAVIPACQGCGLGKWIIALALQGIAKEHQEIFLTTQTTSVAAVGIYLRYGFVPHPYGPDDAQAWSLLSQALNHEIPAPGR